MDELLQKLKKNFSEAEFQELKAAYDFSAAAHEGQKRQIAYVIDAMCTHANE